jgi:hypothetical protein
MKEQTLSNGKKKYQNRIVCVIFGGRSHGDIDWENKNECEKTYLEFLIWVFIGKNHL